MYIDPVNRERDAYLRGEIDIDEFERNVATILRCQAGEGTLIYLQPGERILSRHNAGHGLTPS